MAAKPIERFIKRQIMEQGGWEWVLRRIASGETRTDIAKTLHRPDGPAIDRSTFSNMLWHWVRLDPANAAALTAADIEHADARGERGLHVVEDAPLDRDAIQKARVVSDANFRYAGLRNRERWGESKQQVNVQVNVETMHLDALRHRQLPARINESIVDGSIIDGSSEDSAQDNGVGARETQELAVVQDIA